MNRIVQKLITFIGVFCIAVFSISSIDLVNIFELQSYKNVNEKHIGKLYYEFFKSQHNEIENKKIKEYLESVVAKISESNFIERDIKLHILESDEINAFALPDDHMVIYTGLIKDCDDPEELFGVIAHEIAHMEHNHIMKKVIKELGIAAVISLSSNQSSAEIIKSISEKVISSAFDRNLEEEADKSAVLYLKHSKIDPRPFANFFKKIAEKSKNLPEMIYWVSSHPESMKRYDSVVDLTNNFIDYDTMDKKHWQSFKQYFMKF